MAWACSTSTRSTSATRPRNEGEFFLALAQDGLHALANPFTTRLQVFQELLARDQAAAVFLGGAEVFADLLDLFR
jgi:hypothetical protein